MLDTPQKLKIERRIRGIIGCDPNSCWPCSHEHIVEKLLKLIEEIVK